MAEGYQESLYKSISINPAPGFTISNRLQIIGNEIVGGIEIKSTSTDIIDHYWIFVGQLNQKPKYIQSFAVINGGNGKYGGMIKVADNGNLQLYLVESIPAGWSIYATINSEV